MRIFRFLILLCVAVISGNLSAQSQRELGQLMRNRGEYYFTITVDDPTEIQAISNICSVDGTDGRTVIAYANQQEYDKLLQAGYQLNLQTPPSLREEAVMWEGGDRATYDWNSYLTYGDYVSMMEGFPSSVTNGAHCTFLDLGTLSTTNHRRILGVRLNNGQTNGKPKFLYTSTMHGDEVTGMILMLRLINEFCTSNDTRIQNILNNVDLFIFPCTNPDGTYNGGNNTVTGAKRYNGNNVDLNRHFPDFDDGAHPDGASYYQDECQWMMDLAQEHLFTMGANYHGGAEVMNYPWDTYQPVHPDDDWWQLVSREYANLAQAVNSNYMTDRNNGITNGYAWYTITGSRQDYMNYYGQCREITIECSTTKTPSASQLPNFWNYNHNSMLSYIEQCLNGIHGVVKDANTNEPIEGATIVVKNHDALGSSVTSHAVGDFHRPIKGGTWTLVVSKSGYRSETVNVTVADDQHVDLTVYLTPRGADEMDCYEQVQPSAAGNYVMGYLNGTTLNSLSHNNSSTVTTASLDVTPTDNGFSVEAETIIPQVTLTAYSNGRYYISYNGRYLSRSGSNLTWSTSQPSNGRWYINSNGIYVTSTGWSSTTYYLYYNGSNFALSTSQQNNIHFFEQGECPITPNEDPVPFGPDYPWTVTVGYENYMYLETQIQINGVPVTNTNWVVGAFCGDECRGVTNAHSWWTSDIDQSLICEIQVGGCAGEVINFYLYDMEHEEVFHGLCNVTLDWIDDDIGDMFEPLVLNFVTEQTLTKSITAYTEGETNHYYLIASPIGEVSPEDVTNMLTNNYDLYCFDQANVLEWMNYKPGEGATNPGFDLEAGKGYLYANSGNVTLTFSGFPYTGNGQVMLTKASNTSCEGWNLVGNPFAETAYIGRSFYKMNPEGTDFIASTGAIEAMEGIFVVANAEGETLTFSTEAPSKTPALIVNLTNDRGFAIDRAIVSFGKPGLLPKRMLNPDNTRLYIPQANVDCAVVTAEAEVGEMPLSFKAEHNGTYTLSFAAEEVSFSYLHLIDYITGADVDLLSTSNYTFSARTTDFSSRFRLVFAADDIYK